MDKFTQLHLGNKTSQDNSRKEQIKSSTSRQKVLFGSGLLAVTVLSGVFLLITNGCSKGQKAAPMASSSGQMAAVTNPALAPVLATPAAPSTPPKPAPKRVQRKAPTAAYSDPIHGLYFRYPKNSVLKTGDEPNLDVSGIGPVQMDFVQPGGITVAAVEMPRNSYPGTDFSSAFFSVSIHPELTKSECEQFAFPQNDHPESDESSPPAVKIGGVDLTMIEDMGSAKEGEKTDARVRYYHRFDNGNCYEFGMGLVTDDSTLAGLKPVNREQVFRKLEQILATVKVQPSIVPEVAKDAPVHPVVEGSKE